MSGWILETFFYFPGVFLLGVRSVVGGEHDGVLALAPCDPGGLRSPFLHEQK